MSDGELAWIDAGEGYALALDDGALSQWDLLAPAPIRSGRLQPEQRQIRYAHQLRPGQAQAQGAFRLGQLHRLQATTKAARRG